MKKGAIGCGSVYEWQLARRPASFRPRGQQLNTAALRRQVPLPYCGAVAPPSLAAGGGTSIGNTGRTPSPIMRIAWDGTSPTMVM